MLLVLGMGLLTAGPGRAQLPLPTDPGPDPSPPPPPVVAPGPLGNATTHAAADPARRGAIAAAGLRTPLESLWRHDFDALISNAVAGGGRVYAYSDRRVTAIDLQTGRRLWTSGAQVGGQLAFGAGKVITSGGDGLIALDAVTGRVAWSAPAGGGDPLIAGNLVILQGQGLAAYDLATGSLRWRGGDNDGTGGAPAVSGDRVFQAGGCTAAAVDRRNGRVLWRRNSGCSGGGSDPVALDGTRVHTSFGSGPLAAADGRDLPGPKVDIVAERTGLQLNPGVAAVDLASGGLLWRVKPDETFINDTLGAPLVVGGNVFRTRFEGTVEARALRTGGISWRGRLRPARKTFTGSSSASDFQLAAGEGVLVILRGSTIDGLGSAAGLPASLSIRVPRVQSRLIEANSRPRIRGRVTGNLWPDRVGVEYDRYPFGPFSRAKGSTRPTDKGGVALRFKPDRNTRVRLVGLNGDAQPTRSYTLYAYPRIRLFVRNVSGRIRVGVKVSGSRSVRFRGRRLSLYLYKAGRRAFVKLGSARLRGPRKRRARGVIRFRELKRVGRRDYLFACVPRVHRLGQGAGDYIQRRCGRRRIRI